MRYNITHQDNVTMIEVIGHNIFFGYDDSSDYDSFRLALNDKGIDAFVDLLIDNPTTAFTIFCNGQ